MAIVAAINSIAPVAVAWLKTEATGYGDGIIKPVDPIDPLA